MCGNMGTWEHRAILEGNKGTRTLPWETLIGQVLKDTITERSVPRTEVKLISKAVTTIVNEHLFAKARELGLNEAVCCLEFAINFPSIVEEVIKRISSRICHLSLSQVMYPYLHKM